MGNEDRNVSHSLQVHICTEDNGGDSARRGILYYIWLNIILHILKQSATTDSRGGEKELQVRERKKWRARDGMPELF